MIDDAAADWTFSDDDGDLMGVWFFVEEENPRTKFDVLACVCSFVVERLEKREQLSEEKKADNEPLSCRRSVLNCFLADPPRKSRSKRPRSPRNEWELNPCPTPLKKLKKDDDFGCEKVAVNGGIDIFPKGDAFLPQIVETIDHKVPVSLKMKNNMMSSVGLSEEIEKMNGKEMLLVGEKALTDSDVKRSLSRLMMPESQMMNSWNFLTEEENAFLKIKNGKKWNGIKVSLIEPCGESSSSVTLRRWEMTRDKEKGSSTVSCVLTSGWNQIWNGSSLTSVR